MGKGTAGESGNHASKVSLAVSSWHSVLSFHKRPKLVPQGQPWAHLHLSCCRCRAPSRLLTPGALAPISQSLSQLPTEINHRWCFHVSSPLCLCSPKSHGFYFQAGSCANHGRSSLAQACFIWSTQSCQNPAEIFQHQGIFGSLGIIASILAFSWTWAHLFFMSSSMTKRVASWFPLHGVGLKDPFSAAEEPDLVKRKRKLQLLRLSAQHSATGLPPSQNTPHYC